MFARPIVLVASSSFAVLALAPGVASASESGPQADSTACTRAVESLGRTVASSGTSLSSQQTFSCFDDVATVSYTSNGHARSVGAKLSSPKRIYSGDALSSLYDSSASMGSSSGQLSVGAASSSASKYIRKETHKIYWGQSVNGRVLWSRGARLFMTSSVGEYKRTKFKVASAPLGNYQIALEGRLTLRKDVPVWPDHLVEGLAFKQDVYSMGSKTFSATLYRNQQDRSKCYHRLQEIKVNDRRANKNSRSAEILT